MDVNARKSTVWSFDSETSSINTTCTRDRASLLICFSQILNIFLSQGLLVEHNIFYLLTILMYVDKRLQRKKNSVLAVLLYVFCTVKT